MRPFGLNLEERPDNNRPNSPSRGTSRGASAQEEFAELLSPGSAPNDPPRRDSNARADVGRPLSWNQMQATERHSSMLYDPADSRESAASDVEIGEGEDAECGT